MELEELKNRWTSVDERLKKQEMLNTRMVEEMLKDKSKGALSKLINYETLSGTVSLAAIPLGFWLLSEPRFADTFFPKLIFIAVIIMATVQVILSGYALRNCLMKINFSANIRDNMSFVNKFGIYYRKTKMANYLIVIPVLSLLGILSYYELNASFHLWVFLIAALLFATGITIWIYKAVYDKSIQTIKESLAELSELEEN